MKVYSMQNERVTVELTAQYIKAPSNTVTMGFKLVAKHVDDAKAFIVELTDVAGAIRTVQSIVRNSSSAIQYHNEAKLLLDVLNDADLMNKAHAYYVAKDDALVASFESNAAFQ